MIALSLAVALASSAYSAPPSGGSGSSQNIVDVLAGNVQQIKRLQFRLDRTIVTTLLPSLVATSTPEVRDVDFDFTGNIATIDFVLPDLPPNQVEGGPPGHVRGIRTESPFVAVGVSTLILNPRDALAGYILTPAASSPAGFTVVIARPGNLPSPPNFPRLDLQVDAALGRLVSATTYADTGEVQTVQGFGSYATFLHGQVALPLAIRTRMRARKNMVDLTDSLLTVRIDGGP